MTSPSRQEEFQALLEEHKKILYKICNSYCRDPDARDDLAQDIIIHLWRAFAKFDGQRRFSTWMYRIALNVAISFYRRESTRTRHVISDERYVLEATDETERPSDELRDLYQFIDGLDPLNKALVLLYLDGNAYQDIASVLGISLTNVATKINRLKNKMRQELRGAPQTQSGAQR